MREILKLWDFWRVHYLFRAKTDLSNQVAWEGLAAKAMMRLVLYEVEGGLLEKKKMQGM